MGFRNSFKLELFLLKTLKYLSLDRFDLQLGKSLLLSQYLIQIPHTSNGVGASTEQNSTPVRVWYLNGFEDFGEDGSTVISFVKSIEEM